MKRPDFLNSIRTGIPILLASIIVPLLVLLTAISVYSAWLLQNQAASLGRNTISLFGSQIDSILGMIEKNLLSTDLKDASDSHGLEDELVLSQMRVRNTLGEILGTYEFLDGVFTYAPKQDRLTASMVSYDDLAKKQALVAQTKSYAHEFEKGKVASWTGIQIGNDFCLLRILRRNGYDIGVWIDITKFLNYLGESELQNLDYVGLISQSGTPLFSGYPQFGQQFDLEMSQSRFGVCHLDGETYNTIATPLGSGDLSLVALLHTTNILKGISTFQGVTAIFTAFLTMAAPFFLFLIHRQVVTPTRQICSVMQNFGHGDLSIRFQQPRVYKEFQLIGSTFNHMASEIRQLKIAAYEKQLDAQRTEMQFLQLQLTPHFYINSLNVIYSLAQVSDFSTIEKMVLALTKYFRYSLKAHSDLVPLQDEIQHVESYIAIQNLRYSNRLSVNCRIPQELTELRVPLFLLQTFVENSMKYAFTGDDSVRVEINACLSEGANLTVSIRDNGPGYPAHMLNEESTPDSAHVGIENVRKRLALLYQSKASLTLSNPPEGGAMTTIIIPTK